jgi:hypothetical protein
MRVGRQLLGQPRLAHARLAGQQLEAAAVLHHAVEHSLEPGQVPGSADEPPILGIRHWGLGCGSGRWEVRRRGRVQPFRRWRMPVQRRRLLQDVALELLQGRTRVDAELLRQKRPGVLEGTKGIRLPAATVQGQQQQLPEPLTVAVGRDQGFQLGDDHRMPTTNELGLHPALHSCQPQLLQPRRLDLGEGLRCEVGQRRTAPQAERVRERGQRRLGLSLLQQPTRPGHERLEAAGVNVAGVHAQEIPRRLGDEHARRASRGPIRLQFPAEVGDIGLQRGRSPWWGLVLPQLVDQPTQRDDLVRLD